ncbi:MAG: hypothetical protein E7321_09155 [Clostridiales bacterium]|nr:hypothetical protein [Clostridiales bacterium]
MCSSTPASARGGRSIHLFVQIKHLISDNLAFFHYTGYSAFSQSHFQEKVSCKQDYQALFFNEIHRIEISTRTLRMPLSERKLMNMPQNISPYALLCQSKPKPVYTPPTPYDLYSLTVRERQTADDITPDSTSFFGSSGSQTPITADPPLNPGRRTHYIADIHARHSAAFQHSPQSSRPL